MLLPHKKHIRGEGLPWIVLVNGLFTDQESWGEIIDLLEGHNVLTYNGRGQGDGPALRSEYHLDLQVSDLNDLLKELEIAKFSLIGLSNGARVALKYATAYQDKVISLVACDTYANITPLIKLKIESWLRAHELGGATHRFDVAAPWVWGEEILKTNPTLVETYRERSKLSDENNVVGLIKGALTGEIDLSRIVVPTLLLVGDEDLLTPVKHHHSLLKQIDGAILEVVAGGHASLLEHPQIVCENILPFLRRDHELG